jgi:hypothetical protein
VHFSSHNEQLSYLDASTGEARDMAMLFDCKDSFEAVLGFVAKLKGIAEANPNFVPVITRRHSALQDLNQRENLLSLRLLGRSKVWDSVRDIFTGLAGLAKAAEAKYSCCCFSCCYSFKKYPQKQFKL